MSIYRINDHLPKEVHLEYFCRWLYRKADVSNVDDMHGRRVDGDR